MPGRYTTFDRSRLLIKPLAARVHDLHLDHCLQAHDSPLPFSHPDLPALAARIAAARTAGSARVLMMGAHVIKAGASRVVIDLMERGFVDHVAMNGAGAIHDFELARIGATTERVANYIRSGEFGLWKETGELNDGIAEAGRRGLGLGENAGRRLMESGFPHLKYSILAAGYYFRPHKTMLIRTVADGGESFCIRGDHRATLPALRRALLECP